MLTSRIFLIFPLFSVNSITVSCKDGYNRQNSSVIETLPLEQQTGNYGIIEKSALPKPCMFDNIAFSAIRAHTRSNPGNYDIDHVRFDRTTTNIGYGWNSINSNFQCPCPGIYVFTWTARSPPKSETKIALFVNGKETGHQLWAAKSGKQSASQTAIVSLNVGALVELRLTEGRLYEPANSPRAFNSFSGFKLF